MLEKINSPEDLKKLKVKDLESLASEIREFILERVSKTGGHLASNLGIVDLTIALHYVFNSPKDKFVFDVSHQCYTHKILTGRKNFKQETSGFTNKFESNHDFFNVGHTSTSISLATGLAKARDIVGKVNENIVAIIGDGSLSGGEAYEGLNNASKLNSNIIIIVNDNEMAISPNSGAIYDNLRLLRETNGTAENNFFKSLGFEYKYIEEGNNVKNLVEELEVIKNINKPIILHIHTLKGKGLELAVANKEYFHGSPKFNLKEYISLGSSTFKLEETFGKKTNIETYTSAITKYVDKKISKDKTIVAITPAVAPAMGMVPIREKYPNNFFDVGIAEEHAIAFASGLATNGVKPIVLTSSSFIQRAYDQISQDLALNKNQVLLVIQGAGISGGDATHLGVFDISLLSNIPNFTYMSPRNKKELEMMIDFALKSGMPMGIRVQNGEIFKTKYEEINSTNLNEYEIVEKGENIAIISEGSIFNLAEEVYEKLKEKGINATLINPRILSRLDEKALDEILKNHHTVITIENGILNGGFGEKVASYYGSKPIRVFNFGAKKEFTDRIDKVELLKKYDLTSEKILSKLCNL